MNLTILEKIAGLYQSRAFGHDLFESKKSLLQEINSHITKLEGDIKKNEQLSSVDKKHFGSLAENSFLIEEYKRYRDLVSGL